MLRIAGSYLKYALDFIAPPRKTHTTITDDDQPAANFWLNLTNTPRSYELFDTPEEEEAARQTFAASLEKKATVTAEITTTLSKTTVSDLKDEKLAAEYFSYFIIGCHGEDNEAQKNVAHWMSRFSTSNGFTRNREATKTELKLEQSLPTRALKQEQQKNPSFAFHLGDNVYHSGAKTPNDHAFQACFHSKYNTLFTPLASQRRIHFICKHPSDEKNIIRFHLPGNHDYNYQRFPFSIKGMKQGLEVIANQIAHTFLNKENKFDPKKLDYLSQPFINLETLEKKGFQWFFPSRCYEVTYKGTTFLLMDSNYIGQDLIEYHKICRKLKELIAEKLKLKNSKTTSSHPPEGPAPQQMEDTTTEEERRKEIDNKIEKIDISIKKISDTLEKNPAYWLEQASIRHPTTRKVLMWHHPIFTPGKRAVKIDTPYYLTTEQLDTLDSHGISVYEKKETGMLKVSYSTTLKSILLQLKAHQHPLSIEQRLTLELQGKPIKDEASVITQLAAIHCAHEHIQLASNNKHYPTSDPQYDPHGIFQMIAGGGGSHCKDTKPIEKYDRIKDIILHTSYGFGVVTMSSKPKDTIHLEVFNTKGDYWCLDNTSTTPKFQWTEQMTQGHQDAYKKIRLILLEACYAYFASLSTPTASCTNDDLQRNLNLINSLNTSRQTSLDFLLNLINTYKYRYTYVAEIIPEIAACLESYDIDVPTTLIKISSPTTEEDLSEESELVISTDPKEPAAINLRRMSPS